MVKPLFWGALDRAIENAANGASTSDVATRFDLHRLRGHFPIILVDIAQDEAGAAVFLQVPEFLDAELFAGYGKFLVSIGDFLGGSQFQRETVNRR